MTMVLLVDDDQAILMLLEMCLDRSGYRTVAATDGADALSCIRREPPDLILCDVMMPRLDGPALIEALRADPELAPIPVLLMSAAPKPGDVPCAGFLTKPFTIDTLLASVERCIGPAA